MNDYRQIWTSLGLDMEAHDALLEGLGMAYKDIFFTQPNRPESVRYFDIVMGAIHGLRVKELMEEKEKGRKVIGAFCVFVPEELVIAANAILIGLCSGAEVANDKAEQFVPRSTCALIKAAFGFKLAKVCPFTEVTDMIVGENTCDGKKKSFEQFAQINENFYLMDLPQMKTEAGKALLKAEYVRFAEKLEELTGNKITVENLKRATDIVNAKRAAMHRLAKLRAFDPAPISGLDVLLANQIYFFDDPERFTAQINTLCDELEQRIANGVSVMTKGTPRVIISGCPMAVPNWKVPAIIETSGAIIVGEETCTGERGTQTLTDATATTLDAFMDAIVNRYLTIDCAVFTPNRSRVEHIKKMVQEYKADGVIYYSLQFCQPYTHEAISIERELENEDIPVLSIDTDYSAEDMGQLKTRIEAFIERIK
ncbi:MAG: double-cubane-cluster-containing anaerobic reductase [Marinifilaceae bacterium]